MPASGCVGVTGALHLSNDLTAPIRHIDKKDIFTTARSKIGLSIPPVTDGDGGCTFWDGETLADAVETVAVTAEFHAVVTSMWIRRVNEFIATGRVFLPEGTPLFEAPVLD